MTNTTNTRLDAYIFIIQYMVPLILFEKSQTNFSTFDKFVQ